MSEKDALIQKLEEAKEPTAATKTTAGSSGISQLETQVGVRRDGHVEAFGDFFFQDGHSS